MRILWHSNAPHVGSGYGQQTALFAPRLANAGHEVALSAFYGVSGAVTSYRGLDVYPGYADPFGGDVLVRHALQHFIGDYAQGWVLTLCDVWALNAPGLEQLNVASWVPVDHAPVPPAVWAFFQRTGAVPIAMSRFGEEQLRGVGLDPLYVPHGVDLEVLKPVDPGWLRGQLDVPEDAFLVGMVAANKGRSPSRKAFGQALQAFAHLRRRDPLAFLYLHTDRDGIVDGVNLPRLAAACGIPEEAIRYVDQYEYRLGLPASHLASVYSGLDVLLNASMGEGFGVPIIEAQACGTPVIVSEFSAMPELVGAGWTVKGQASWDAAQDAWLFEPSVASIITALEQARKQRGSEKLRARALAKAVEYDADRVCSEFWLPALERLESRTKPPVPTLQSVKQ